MIKYLIRIDCENNFLRLTSDIGNKLPRDYDVNDSFGDSFFHIWDYAALNNGDKI